MMKTEICLLSHQLLSPSVLLVSKEGRISIWAERTHGDQKEHPTVTTILMTENYSACGLQSPQEWLGA